MLQEISRNGLKPSVVKGLSSRGGGHLSTPADSFRDLTFAKKSGFTLAEMMVVMLIMSIILAAMAPVMTTRNKSDYSSPWRYSPRNNSDAYFGAGDSQVALLGQADAGDAERDTKLLIRTAANSGFSHILFKTGESIVGRLYFDDSNLFISNTNPSNSGSNNTTIGVDAFMNNTSGQDNTVMGYNALTSNTTGGGNVAIGSNSLQNNRTGNDNIAIGTNANYGNFTSEVSKTIAIGNQTSTYGNGSIAIGSSLISSEGNGTSYTGAYSSGSRSIAIGNGSSAISINSVALGTSAQAGFNAGGTHVGANSIAIGFSSELRGDNSIALGSEAYVSGQNSVAIGYESMTGSPYSLAIGPYLAKAYGNNSIAIGTEAFAGVEDDNAIDNTIAIGSYSRVSGTDGIAIGNGAKSVGPQYGSGGYNIAIGSEAMGNARAGDNSIAIGHLALNKMNNIVGATPNIGIGYKSLMNLEGGVDNVSVGFMALSDLVSGNSNVAIGPRACRYVTGTNKTCIGTNSGPESGSDWASSSDSIERIFIGSQSKFDGGTAVLEIHNDSTPEPTMGNDYGNINKTAVVVHGGLVVTGPIYNLAKDAGSGNQWKQWGVLEYNHGGNGLVQGSQKHLTNANHYLDYVDDVIKKKYDSLWGNSGGKSDRRLKYVGKESSAGLDKIRQLKVFNYTFKKDEKKTPHVGVIAQDLQKVFPDAVEKGVDGFLTIRMEDMFYAVINAIKELDSRVTALEKENQELKARIERLEAKIK